MTNQRIKELQQILESQEPSKSWHCKDHNALGTGGTNRFCCEEELEELLANDK